MIHSDSFFFHIDSRNSLRTLHLSTCCVQAHKHSRQISSLTRACVEKARDMSRRCAARKRESIGAEARASGPLLQRQTCAFSGSFTLRARMAACSLAKFTYICTLHSRMQEEKRRHAGMISRTDDGLVFLKTRLFWPRSDALSIGEK